MITILLNQRKTQKVIQPLQMKTHPASTIEAGCVAFYALNQPCQRAGVRGVFITAFYYEQIMDFISIILMAIAQAFYAFSEKPSGTYQDAQATTTFEFKSRKVFVRFTTGSAPLKVSLWPGSVTVKFKEGNRVYNFDSKTNSFTGPNGIKLNHVAADAKSTQSSITQSASR